MTVTEHVDQEGRVAGEPSPAPPRRRRRVVAAAAVALLVVVAGVAVALRDDGPGTTTTSPSTTASTTASTVPSAVTAVAVYPDASSAVRYGDPVSAARGYATDFVGMTAPLVGDYRAGDTGSGEVDVRSSDGGPPTTVIVRLLHGTWWVLGSATPNIVLSEPAALATIASPVLLRGRSVAFEAVVNTEVRQDGRRPPIGEGTVMGGGTELAPFEGTLAFAAPSAERGAVVLFTRSAKDGAIVEASVVRVQFGATGTLAPASACPGYRMDRPAPVAGQMVVTVFYGCGVDGSPLPTYRLVPASAATLRASLEQLLSGPTAPESAAGLQSWFSPATAGMLAGVTVQDGRAVVDFHDLRAVIPNASSSAGSAMLLSQLDATVFQFPSVSSVVYRIDGDCQAFTEWLQMGGCTPRTR